MHTAGEPRMGQVQRRLAASRECEALRIHVERRHCVRGRCRRLEERRLGATGTAWAQLDAPGTAVSSLLPVGQQFASWEKDKAAVLQQTNAPLSTCVARTKAWCGRKLSPAPGPSAVRRTVNANTALAAASVCSDSVSGSGCGYVTGCTSLASPDCTPAVASPTSIAPVAATCAVASPLASPADAENINLHGVKAAWEGIHRILLPGSYGQPASRVTGISCMPIHSNTWALGGPLMRRGKVTAGSSRNSRMQPGKSGGAAWAKHWKCRKRLTCTGPAWAAASGSPGRSFYRHSATTAHRTPARRRVRPPT